MKLEERPGRAWLEISLENLRWNYKKLCGLLPAGCKCMAVVKADAYGHGAVRTAQVLSEEGCDTFAVASLEEGMELRGAGVQGKILVLWYTMPRDAFLLERYQLMQTVVDEAHGAALARTGCKITCHLAVDTGMNRLGISYRDRDAIERVLGMEGIRVEGIYSHLSVADSPLSADKSFTEKQIADFLALKSYLEEKGWQNLVCHMQSSYGLLYYPMEGMQYVRPGIALYGCASNTPKEEFCVDLRPALQLKCRIGCIRTVEQGDFVSYGRTWEAKERRRIAVMAIGYADGLPRSLSGQGQALVLGKRVPMVGRICMDQTMLDITDVREAAEGDIVTLIGRDGTEEIKAVELAQSAGTITNELLSRLGGRLTKTFW